MFDRGRTIAVLSCLVLVGCDGAVPEGEPQTHEARVDELQMEPTEEAPTEPTATGEWLVLEQNDGEETLAGVLEPVPPRTDAYRVIELRTHPAGLHLAGARVLDARTASDGVVSIGADRVLRHHTAESTVELDTGVLGPLSVAAGRVAYVRGEAPDLHLHVVDLVDGQVERLAPGYAPVWSPALSEDGREVIFATAVRGRPELVRSAADGGLHRIDVERTPSSPRAPVWRGNVLTYEDELGMVRVDLDQARAERMEVQP